MTNAPISLLEAFEELRDPRARECAYQLDELLLAAICSVTRQCAPMPFCRTAPSISSFSKATPTWLLPRRERLKPSERMTAALQPLGDLVERAVPYGRRWRASRRRYTR
jgi:hypothetical protein